MRTRVLVVVRMDALRRVMTDVLEAAGYTAFGCSGVDVARSMAASCSPDVAVVDDNLPDGGSAELVRLMRSGRPADGRPVLVIALTTRASVAQMTAAGAHCTIWKPAAEGELLGAVRRLEDVYQRRHEGTATGADAEPLRTPPP